jgi:hypothetical protein
MKLQGIGVGNLVGTAPVSESFSRESRYLAFFLLPLAQPYTHSAAVLVDEFDRRPAAGGQPGASFARRLTHAFAIRAAVLIAWPGIYHLAGVARWHLRRRRPRPPQLERSR